MYCLHMLCVIYQANPKGENRSPAERGVVLIVTVTAFVCE